MVILVTFRFSPALPLVAKDRFQAPKELFVTNPIIFFILLLNVFALPLVRYNQ